MSQIDKSVFISYRRINQYMATSVYNSLSQQGYDVFLDHNSIHSGSFEKVIFEHIKARAHFIVILTNEAMNRLDDSEDLFRQEIELALTTKRNIIPLTFGDFDWLKAESLLINQLSQLSKYNALRVPDDYFDAAMSKLCNERLNIALDAVSHPPTYQGKPQQPNQQKPTLTAEQIAQTYLEKGYECFDNSEFTQAIMLFSKAIEAKHNHVDAYFHRGSARLIQGDLRGAIADFNEATIYKPHHCLAIFNRAIARERQQDDNGAIADYEKYLSAISTLGNRTNQQTQIQQAQQRIYDIKSKRFR